MPRRFYGALCGTGPQQADIIRGVVPPNEARGKASADIVKHAHLPGIEYNLANVKAGLIAPAELDDWTDTLKLLNGDWSRPQMTHYCFRSGEDRRSGSAQNQLPHMIRWRALLELMSNF